MLSSARPATKLVAIGCLFIVELVAISFYFDTSHLKRRVGLVGFIEEWGPKILQTLVAFVTFNAILLLFKARASLQAVSDHLAQTSISWRSLAGHVGALALVLLLSVRLVSETSGSGYADLLAAAWIFAGFLAIVLGLSTFLSIRSLLDLIAKTRVCTAMAAIGATGTFLLGPLAVERWEPLAALTFAVVATILGWVRPELVIDTSSHVIGTPSFQVVISPECSGLEGAGLMLIFGFLWLWFFRNEYRFPRALLLLPAGVTFVWILNAVRIAALILIGDSGAVEVAAGGFHSQAGWIAFNFSALGFAFLLHRVSWLRRKPQLSYDEHTSLAKNPTTAFLMPFLGILAAAMATRAITADFDLLYPVRFLITALAIWYFRREYKQLDWRVGWTGPIIGFTVFCLWLAFNTSHHPSSEQSLAIGLASLPHPIMLGWLAVRTLASAITVPVAEELAFRGYLLRRFVSPDFEFVRPKAFTMIAILGSSALFGLLHGDRWIEATIAGALYAIAYRSFGRFGDAVAAHAVTNGLLAAWVLTTGAWELW